MLTLLTPHDGKLKAIAKGVRRPRSRLGGSGGAVRRAAPGARPGANVRRDHLGQRRSRLAVAARAARVDGHGLVPGRARRARRRGARLRLPGVRAAQARLPAARRRHGARRAWRAGSSSAWPTRSACGRRSSAASSAIACSSRTRSSAGCRPWAGRCARAIPTRRPRWRRSRWPRSSCCAPTDGWTSRPSPGCACRSRSRRRSKWRCGASSAHVLEREARSLAFLDEVRARRRLVPVMPGAVENEVLPDRLERGRIIGPSAVYESGQLGRTSDAA